MLRVDDVRIRAMKKLIPPSHVLRAFPLSQRVIQTITRARLAVHRILHGQEDRLMVVMGPCSIHDPQSAREYAMRLAAKRQQYQDTLEIIMRVYFEKPRTTVGWKGLINDPYLDNSFQVNDGLRIARELLMHMNALGLPAGTEFLDVISSQYFADLVSWGAIGARTSASQIHRELASGLSCPIGFKNGLDGDVKVAIDAIKAASQPHHFLSVTKDGQAAIVSTQGNEDVHMILRGGKMPNYDAHSVDATCQAIAAAGFAARLMIDASHANSQKQPENQIAVCADIAQQIAQGENRIMGVMVESHLVGGQQVLIAGKALTYGQSITDGCLGWDDSAGVLACLADAVQQRRLVNRQG